MLLYLRSTQNKKKDIVEDSKRIYLQLRFELVKRF